MEKSPTYLQTKVEDRLTAKGKNYKIKIEENKKSFYEHLTPQNKNVSFLTSNKIKNEYGIDNVGLQLLYMKN